MKATTTQSRSMSCVKKINCFAVKRVESLKTRPGLKRSRAAIACVICNSHKLSDFIFSRKPTKQHNVIIISLVEMCVNLYLKLFSSVNITLCAKYTCLFIVRRSRAPHHNCRVTSLVARKTPKRTHFRNSYRVSNFSTATPLTRSRHKNSRTAFQGFYCREQRDLPCSTAH